ncbi:50S ribosomal protein L15 [subsurface metagenome]
MPLMRRVARRGFSNHPFKKNYAIVKVERLNVFNDGEKVTRASLMEKGMLRTGKLPVKILGNGEVKKKLIVEVDKLTAGARAEILKAGGEVIEVGQRVKVENDGS